MPILVKDYLWTQSEKSINIRVPLKDVSHEKVDIFSTDSYIKAHFQPFLFEAYLLYDVDINKSRCVVKEDIVVFDLTKREEQHWLTLEKELSKPEKMEIKQKILEKCQEEAKQASEDKRIKKSHLDRFTVQEAMELDSKQHNIMDSRRDAETHKAMNDLEEWRQLKGNNKPYKPAKIVELSDESAETGIKQDFNNESKLKTIQVKPKSRKKVFKQVVTSEFVERKKEESTKKVIPKMRELGLLEITHTPRTFPTPTRESAAQEEEQWLKNITLARRATGFVSEDLRPEEQDPQWCKEKGDEFFKSGNFLGAISAYTHGITLSDKLPTLYSNRSATHFALGNFNKCIQDCSQALDLLKPVCEGNRRSRAKCIARRGAALARVGYLSKGINEMKAASKLLPDDEKIKQDIDDMERAWEQNPDSD